MNKRGQGLSTNAIILIVLGVIVLVILIVGFTLGWDTFGTWLSTNNVNSVVAQCQIACSSGSTYDFCTQTRTLKADDLPGGAKEVAANCTFFANDPDYQPYAIAACTDITCPATELAE